MTATFVGTLLAIMCACVEGVAQVALKQSTLQPPRRMAWIATGVTLFAIEAILYTAALQRLDVSLAYSLSALSFVAVSLLSAFVLYERISLIRWMGIALIVAGAAILASHG